MARPRKDVMKAQEIVPGRPPKPEGGLAHSEGKTGDMWGGRVPPFPRSEIYKSKDSNRVDMNLVR